MLLDFIRTLRTPHSERFVLQKAGADIGALDLHYRANGAVDGTLIIFEDAPFRDDQIPDMLAVLDERLLPDVSMGEKNLSFTVVRGRVLGAFVADKPK